MGLRVTGTVHENEMNLHTCICNAIFNKQMLWYLNVLWDKPALVQILSWHCMYNHKDEAYKERLFYIKAAKN